MSRAERLLDLIQLLRGYRYPVTGAKLADELHVSLRTLYRDIATLQAQGAQIEGEPGLGYVLKPGFLLPPLMFSEEEIEAIVLGMRWVADRGDPDLARAARRAQARIAAVLPGDLRQSLEANTLFVPPIGAPVPEEMSGKIDLATVRRAIRSEYKVVIDYLDLKGERSEERTIWPLALAFFERVRVIVAWCERREGYRHFRADRILSLRATEERYPRRRARLLHEWRELNGIPAPPT